jgi:broad specificity phosphatase PhoE
MERMWSERADYGHFFYRIPNGESAADAYDRIAGFNESLWRQFGDAKFPSVCVLVTHGLMTRVFLMKWYVDADLSALAKLQLPAALDDGKLISEQVSLVCRIL